MPEVATGCPVPQPFDCRPMLNTTLLHQLITASAERSPDAPALTAGKTSLSYRELDEQVAGIASGLIGLAGVIAPAASSRGLPSCSG